MITIVGALLFGLALAGIILNRRNMIVLLMCIELMLLAVNMNFIAFSHFLNENYRFRPMYKDSR